MRFLTLAALAALTLGFTDVRPADASRADTAKQSNSSHSAQKRAERRAAKKAERRTSSRTNRTTSRRTASLRTTTKSKSAKRRAQTSRSVSSGGSHGIASYYWQPQRVASGGQFNPNALTAAHRTLPFGTRVKVTNKRNGRSVVVTINDRGPFIKGRIIDLSKRAAGVIGMQGAGLAPVSVEVVGRS